MFVETIFHHRDTNSMYLINCYHLYRNDATHQTPQDLMVGQQYIAELGSCLDILTSQISMA